MLPAFSDMHVHLDKTLYGLPWQAQSPKKRTVLEMIAYEQEIILNYFRHRPHGQSNLLTCCKVMVPPLPGHILTSTPLLGFVLWKTSKKHWTAARRVSRQN
ncbi:hypothetical protein KUH03_17050 [Sphingobacterium sp. E70]|uniref:hypothetical protein n=1 Tax=Sphingobacterium sp. E70 TaxID=2853439 RepID=UPI00211D051E|nr:hypothetical protein [Sphingobacterium sp. E70]ULT28147.1 hypothetical protein KUH03_17050 [Sphingobacterium sp. E70]